jgi:SAM-dependent methyltransferase
VIVHHAGRASETLSRFWDSRAARYEEAYRSSGRLGRFLRSRQSAVLDLLGGGPGEVLDVGMGPGHVVASLATRGWRISGVDVSERMVALARERLPEARSRLLPASVDRLPFDEASFDAVVATGVLGSAGWSQENLVSLARVLRPGGVAVVSLPNRWSLSRLWRRGFLQPIAQAMRGDAPPSSPNDPPGSAGRPRRIWPPGRRRFRQLLQAAGLEVESLRYASHSLGPLELLSPPTAARVIERLERGGALNLLLAGQLVYGARKTTIISAFYG